MRILIVTKTTNYELHGSEIEAKVALGRVKPDAIDRLRVAHAEHYDALLELRRCLSKYAVEFDEVSREFPRPWSRHYDMVITVGGDGTLLAASHQMPSGGILAGIRSSQSSVGYLCCANLRQIESLIQCFLAGKLKLLNACRIKALVRRIDTQEEFETEPILNDFLYTNANPAATTRYKITVNQGHETHRSSGIWVATPIGSTAAILAAGGERRPLEESEFQFRIRELYRLGITEPHIEGGLFDPDRDVLEIENRCPKAILALDGQHGSLDLTYGDTVRFLRAAPIQLVRGFT